MQIQTEEEEEEKIVRENLEEGRRLIRKDYHLDPRNEGCYSYLEDELETTPTETNHPYTIPPKQCPPVEVVDKWDLPTALTHKSDASAQGIALCGIFPQIRRAWASIDNCLYLWGFEKWCRDDKCLEYKAGEQVLCAVGIVIAKPRVFIESIQFLLVLATPSQLMLVGVCCPSTTNGRGPYAELSLQPLLDYAVPSDGVAMACITCTDRGRIFLAGRDGHIYELKYTARSSWHKPCRKVCLTSGLCDEFLRWVVPGMCGFGVVDPAIEMIFDNERNILYALTEAKNLKVFELGVNDGVLKKVAEERTLVGGSSTPSIVSISPISLMESSSLQLVVVLSDGRRMYYRNNSGYSAYRRPNCLDVVSSRPCPPLRLSGVHGLAQSKFGISHYSAGNLVLSESSPSTASSLVIVSKDYTTEPSPTGNIGTLANTQEVLSESVSSLPVEGKILFMADALPLPDTAMTLNSLYEWKLFYDFFGDEWPLLSLETASTWLWSQRDLSLQHMLPRKRVVIFSTMSMMELVFNRPVDILGRLLESNSTNELLDDFFYRFGTAEASAMCLMLAAKLPDDENFIGHNVVNKATEVYENPRFVGMPHLQGCEPVFSGAFHGLLLCTQRMLPPLWCEPFMKCESCSDSTRKSRIVCKISVQAMQVLENKLCSLESFLRSRKSKRAGIYARGNADVLASIEVKATDCLRQLLLRTSEALFLLQLLSKHRGGLIFESFGGAELRSQLLGMPFEELVCSEEGQMLATMLISALMEKYTGRDGTGAADDIIGELCKGCPSYFKEKQYKFHFGMECLDRAVVSSSITERENLARAAFNFLNHLPLSAELHMICTKFEQLRFYEAVVWLPLQKAQALDPDENAINEQIDQEIRDCFLAQRENCYEIIGIALRKLKREALQRDSASANICQPARSFLDQSSPKEYICQIVQLAVQSLDRIFHEYLYRTMIDMSLENELLQCAGPDLELFLHHAVSEPRNEITAVPSSTRAKYLDLLAQYYVSKRQHLKASNVYIMLAERSA